MVTTEGIITGGGIAGLTAALSMQQRGMQVKVYESAPVIQPLGAGIWMAPNAMQVFHRLGIAGKINAAGVPLRKIQITDNRLLPILRTNQENIKNRFGYTTTAIKRSRLQEVLLEEVGVDHVHLSKTCVSVTEEGKRVSAMFADGMKVAAAFVVAADGIHSATRNQLFHKIRLTDTGCVVWRGISALQLKPEFKQAIIEVWHNGLRFGFSEVADGVVDWFAVLQTSMFGNFDHSVKGCLLHAFREVHYPVPAILECCDEAGIIKNIITDFDPLPVWHKGRVCLIGDAAHTSTPYMGQGGCQAVEDAYVVAMCLEREPTVEKAFVQLEHIRRRKARQIVTTSRLMGAVGYMQGTSGMLRNFIMRNTPAAITERQFVRVYSLNY